MRMLELDMLGLVLDELRAAPTTLMPFGVYMRFCFMHFMDYLMYPRCIRMSVVYCNQFSRELPEQSLPPNSASEVEVGFQPTMAELGSVMDFPAHSIGQCKITSGTANSTHSKLRIRSYLL